MIVDVHAHWGPWFFTMDVAELNLATMDRYGIGVSIVSATEAVIYDASAGNRALDGWLATTERHYGYVTVNPRRLAEAERDLDEYLPKGRFVGVKIHTDYTGSPVTSPQLREALALVASRGVPALVHTWGASVLDLAQAVMDTPACARSRATWARTAIATPSRPRAPATGSGWSPATPTRRRAGSRRWWQASIQKGCCSAPTRRSSTPPRPSAPSRRPASPPASPS